MMFDPKDKSLKISVENAAAAGKILLAAIRYFRESAGLPLRGRKSGGSEYTCEYCILSAAKKIGIDLGSVSPGKLDVREYR